VEVKLSILIRSKWNGNEVGRINFLSGTDNTNKDDGELSFYTRLSGSALAEAMRIDSSGNVGIGDDGAELPARSNRFFSHIIQLFKRLTLRRLRD